MKLIDGLKALVGTALGGDVRMLGKKNAAPSPAHDLLPVRAAMEQDGRMSLFDLSRFSALAFERKSTPGHPITDETAARELLAGPPLHDAVAAEMPCCKSRRAAKNSQP